VFRPLPGGGINSLAPLDENALAACQVYLDHNPVRQQGRDPVILGLHLHRGSHSISKEHGERPEAQ
jgi:hypothetical protein